MKSITNNTLVKEIKDIIINGKRNVATAINVSMVYTYYEIGKKIVEEEQQGQTRASYGKELLINLSKALTKEFGIGYSQRNLASFRKFYLLYKDNAILQPPAAKSYNLPKTSDGKIFFLSWSIYLQLIRITNFEERSFYEIETYKNNWSKRELARQYESSLYERLYLSLDKGKVKELSKRGQIIENPTDAIKDPYVLEFLDLKEDDAYTEKDLETGIINKLQDFLMELGKGFTFVGRQVRLTFEEQHFYTDLVFYNRILRCFVLIDLKIGKLKHQDIGQMQMYVNYYDRHVKLQEENKTIGILLCKDKDDAIVELTLPEDNDQIFASKYHMVLPSKNTLKKLIKSKRKPINFD